MTHSRSIFSTLLFAAATWSASCAGTGLDQSLDSQLGELRSLRGELESEWNGIGSMLTGLESQVAAFSNSDLDLGNFDYSLLTDAIKSAATPVTEGDVDVVEASAKTEEALEGAIETTDAATRAKVNSLYESGAQIYSQLQSGLPNAIQSLLGKTSSTLTKLTELRATGASKVAIAEQNPLSQDSDVQELKRDQATLEKELGQVEQLANDIAGKSTSYTDRIATALSKFTGQLEALGK